MAELDNSAVIGDFEVRMEGWDDLTAEDTQYYNLKRYDKALGNARHHSLHLAPASFYQIDIYCITDPGAGASVDSCRQTAPWPFTIWAADVGAETSGGATGTVDIYADDGTTDASILDAAEDVKTGIGVGQRVAPEDGSEEIAYGTEIYIESASGGGGGLVGAQAHLYVQRR